MGGDENVGCWLIERERETDRELLEHHTKTLIDWKHWTRSSNLLIDVGSSFHSASRQFNDQSRLRQELEQGALCWCVALTYPSSK